MHDVALGLPQAGINQVHSWSTVGAQLEGVFQFAVVHTELRIFAEAPA